MAWRAPRFGLLHALREAGAAAVTVTSAAAGFPKERLLDDRRGTVFKFGSSAADLRVELDRGAGFAALDQVDRLYIPAGHNLSGTIDVLDDDNSGFATPATLLSAGAVPTSGAVDLALTTPGSQRYVRVEFNGTGQWELPELILTRTLTTVRGPEPAWTREEVEAAVHAEKSSGAVAHLALGPDRARWDFRYRLVSDSGDLSTLDAVIAHGTALPLILDPPYDDEPAILANLIRRVVGNDHPDPAAASGRRARYEIEFLESTA